MRSPYLHPISACQISIRTNFGLLPAPTNSATSLASAAVNLLILGLILYVGMTAKRFIQAHKFEQTELIFPTTPPPPPMKLKIEVPPPPPKIEIPKPAFGAFQNRTMAAKQN